MVKHPSVKPASKRFILLLFFSISVSQIHVSLSQNVREVPLFGLANASMRYNNFNGSDIEYHFGEQDFNAAAECMNPHVLTFPAANPCYFDWTTGWAYDEAHIIDHVNGLNIYYDISNSSPESTSFGDYFMDISKIQHEEPLYEWWDNTDGSWNEINIDIEDFSNFIGDEIAGIFSLNMLTGSIETTIDMIDQYKSIIPFEYIELGSEYYLRAGGDKWEDNEPKNYKYDPGEAFTTNGDKDGDGFFDPGRFDLIYPTPQSFGIECDTWIKELSPILSNNTKFSISCKNKPNDPRSNDWNRQVLHEIDSDFLDTIYLSWHEYLVIGENVDDPIPLTSEQVLAFPQFTHEDVLIESGMHPDTIAVLEEETGLNIRIWLTESAFREKKYDPEPWIFKWAQTLVNIQNYSLKLRNPYIDIMMIQSLMGWNTTSAINHGNQFPDYVPEYNGEDSCSPYGRTATAFSINFWNDITDGMTYMQELHFTSETEEHLGTITQDPFDNYLSPDEGYIYSYLIGWKLFNEDQSIQRALITNVSNENKTLLFSNDYATGFTNNTRCIYITSRDQGNTPSINQYINGDSDLFFDTSYVDFSDDIEEYKQLVVPAYSIILFEEVSPSNFYTEPNDYHLHPIYPNPFNPTATIRYDMSKLNFVSINIYDIQGRLVEKLYNANQKSGYHTLRWDASNVSSGVYVVRMQVDDRIETKTITFIK